MDISLGFAALSLIYLAVWVLLLIGALRVIWFAWVGPKRLTEIERKLDKLANSMDALAVALERHIDQR